MFKKLALVLLISSMLITLIGCSSKFEKAQRERQMEITQTVSQKMHEYLIELVVYLQSNIIQTDDIDSNNLIRIAAVYPEVSALFLYDQNLQLIRKAPDNFDSNEVTENCLSHKDLKNIAKIHEPFIGHSLFKKNDVFICIGIPIHNSKNGITHIVLVLVDTVVLFSSIEQTYIQPYPYSLMVLNDEQQVVYDSDPMRTGQDFIMEDDSEESVALKNLYNMMTENRNSFYVVQTQTKSRTLRKIYTWNAIDEYGECFYVTLVRNLTNSTVKPKEDIYLLSTLRSYAVKDTLIDPIVEGTPDKIDDLLEYLYEQNPDTYAIQLADTSGTVISGWPLSNTLLGYSIKMQKNKPFDTAIKNVIQTKQELVIESTLLEGGVGTVFLIPVLVHEDLYGVLFAIEPKGR